ncbi:MAG: flagellin [Nitrosomonadales bacterium]|nr:flagellin [Nitrosomonadales bacterium]
MPQFINTNIASLNAQRNLNSSQSALQTSLQRLSSGLRINSAKDDAAGMAIASRMTSQINGNNQASRNANDGISLAQTAEGDLAQIGINLQRMRDLAVQSANATNSVSDRASLDAEVQSLAAEIDRVAQNSSFNGTKLLDGTFTAQTFHVGAGATANDRIDISSIASARTTALGSAGATTSATVTSAAPTAALTAGYLTLNGFQVGASVAGALPGQSTGSGYSIAAAINAISGSSGVTATANATTVAGAAASVFTAFTAANSFTINGISVGAIAAGGQATGQGANVAAAVNSVSNQTGVTATANATTGAVTLTAADGRDISLLATGTTTAAAALAAFGLTTGDVVGPVAAVATHATVTLNSTNAAGIVIGGGVAAAAVGTDGFTRATTAPTTVSSVSSISSMNVLTAAAATSALAVLDGAITTINSSRASLGAYQNRFASVVTSLQTTSENLTASRSRIMDTDFAAETSQLTRNQILQQAGTAMLAQANQLPQNVLTLLR